MNIGRGIAIIVVSMIVLDGIIVFFWRRYNQSHAAHRSRLDLLKQAIMFVKTGFSNFKTLWVRAWKNTRFRQQMGAALELLLLALWAFWICKPYLNLDPLIIPAGGEFPSVIQSHHLWTFFRECGWCAVWNGSMRGGYPAFVDLHGSMLHPLVMATTLLLGVVNGAKIAIALAFWLAGVAQWWLARELKVGWPARLWSAAMAIAGGHLSSRMELGTIGIILSTVMASFVIVAVLALYHKPTWRSVVLLAIATACTIVAGQGYIQVGLVLMLPAALILFINKPTGLRKISGKYALGFGLGLLLAAPLLIPFLHFAPNFFKTTDPYFSGAQPLYYLPLNLVISERAFYYSESLQKLPYPYLNGHYIGWIPVILALLGVSYIKRENRHSLLFLITCVLLAFLAASATSLKWIAEIYPQISGVRFPTLIAGLAILPLLGLAAIGLDKIMHYPWPRLWIDAGENDPQKKTHISLMWILLIPLFYSLRSGYLFSKLWMYPVHQSSGITQLLKNLETDTLEWVAPPFGEHAYIEPAIGMGLKLSPGILSWGWKDRQFPQALLEASRGEPPAGTVTRIGIVDDIPIYQQENEPPYAAVFAGDNFFACAATGAGGDITVTCDAAEDGQLIVQENMWTGWQAWLDERPVPLANTAWLEVTAPAGSHEFKFRYLPWDVPLGLSISLLGILLSAWLWFRKTPSETES